MTNNTPPEHQPNWFLIGMASIGAAIIFFQPFLAAMALSAVFAFLLFPVYKWLSKRMNKKVAASLTMLTSVLIFLLPLIFLGILAVGQAISLINTVSGLEYSPGSPLYESIQSISATVGTVFPPETVAGTQDSIKDFVLQTIPFILNQSIKLLAAVAASAPQLITSAIIYGFMFNMYLLYYKDIRNFIVAASPFSEKESGQYLQRAGLIVTASLKGQFVISLVTAVSSSLLLFVLGFQSFFLPMTILLTILGMVPLGSGIVVIPIALFAMVSGNFWPGLWVLVIYLLVICNFDSFLRPRLIPKKAGMLPALTVVATFSGIYYFGLMGIVYGPLIVILLMTTAQIYLARKQPI